MNYLGVDTWDEVEAMFEKGGRFAGAWGFLEVLHRAELGDMIAWWSGPFGSGIALNNPDLYGVLQENDAGQLIFQGSWSYGRRVTASAQFLGMINFASPDHYYTYRVDRVINSNFIISRGGTIGADQQFTHIYLSDQIDWMDAAFDIAGIATDLASLGIGGRYINAAQAAKAGLVLDLGGLGTDGISVLFGGWAEENKKELGYDVAGFFVPVVPDMMSLLDNLFDARH